MTQQEFIDMNCSNILLEILQKSNSIHLIFESLDIFNFLLINSSFL